MGWWIKTEQRSRWAASSHAPTLHVRGCGGELESVHSEKNVEHTRKKPHLEYALLKCIDIEEQGLRVFMISEQRNH